MPFDLSSATPVQGPPQAGFDLSSAQPVQSSGFDLSSAQPVQQTTLGQLVGALDRTSTNIASNIKKTVGMGIGLAGNLVPGDKVSDFGYGMAREENEELPGSISGEWSKESEAAGIAPTGGYKKAADFASNVANLAAGPVGLTSVMGQQAVLQANNNMDKGVDRATATVDALSSYLLNAAGGAVLPGQTNLLGAAVGNAALGATSRGLSKEILEDNGYKDIADQQASAFDLESAAEDFAFGAVAHKLSGHQQEQPGTDTSTHDAASELLKAGSEPDANLTDVDTSQIKNPYETGIGKELANGEDVQPSGEKPRVAYKSDMQSEMDALARPEDKVDYLNKQLDQTRQDTAQTVDNTPYDPNAKMEDGTDRVLTPVEQKLRAERIAEGELGENDALSPDKVNNFWNAVRNARDLGSIMSEPDANGHSTIDPIKALQWMKTYSNKTIRDVATRLLKYPETLSQLSIKVLHRGDFNGDASERGSAGYYLRGSHTITLGSKWANDTVLAHELVHAVTSRGLTIGEYMSYRDLENLGMEKLKELYLNMKGHLEALNTVGNKQVDSNGGITHDFSDTFPLVGRGRIYGLHNVHELLSEAFTNDSFRDLLKRYGTWDGIKKSISKLLGGGSYSALDHILETGERIADIANQNREVVSREIEKIAKAYGSEDAVRILHSAPRESIDNAVDRGLDKDPKVKAIISNVPGMRGLDAKNIPAAPDPKDILSLLKKAADIKDNLFSGYEKNFTVSGEQLANLWRSPGLYAFTRIFDRAQKLGHLADEQITKPLRRQIKELIPDSNVASLKRVMDVMHAEDFYKDAIHKDGKRLDPEQLKKVLSPKEQQVYKLLRDNFDKSFAKVNKALTEMGQKPIPPRAAYTASSRHGPWSAEVHRDWTDKAGNKRSEMVGYITGHTIAEVRKGLEYAKKQPGVTRTTEPAYKKTFNGRSDNLFQHYDAVSRLLGPQDPATQSIRAALEQHASAQGMNFEGYRKHLMDKSGVAYAEGDRPWLSDRRNVKDWYRNQLDAIQEAHEWSHMQEAVEQANQVIHDPELNATHPNMANYLREYARKQMGFGKSEHIGAIENAIAKTMGRIVDTIPGLKNLPVDVHAGMIAMREAKSLLYLKALGFWKPQHFLVNGMMQPLFTMPRHIKMSAEGFSHNPLVTFHDGMLNAQAILLNHYTGGKFLLNDRQQRMADYIKSNNLATNNPFSDTGDIGQNSFSKIDSNLRKYGGFMMQEGERVGRINAFASYESHLRQSGKFGDNEGELFREAERNTTETMGSFRHTDRPAAFTKLGIAGTGLATLRQFEINFLNQFHDYIKYGIEKKNYTPLMAFSALQLCMAGVMGFIGFETLDQIWTTIRDLIPSNMISKELATWSPKKFVLENAPTILSRGPVSDLTGINFASSLEAGTVVDPSVNGMLPFISEIKNTVVPAWNLATNPTDDNLHKFVWNETPYGSRGMLETGKVFGHDLPDAINTKSWYNSPSGVSQSPNNPGQGTYTRDEDDTNIRSFGFTSTKEAMSKEAEYMSKEETKVLQTRQQDTLDNIDSAIRNNDLSGIEKSVMKYIDMQGDPNQPLSTERLTKVVEDWNLDYRTRLTAALKSGDLTAVYKYQRLNDMMQQLDKRYSPQQGVNYGPANAAR